MALSQTKLIEWRAREAVAKAAEAAIKSYKQMTLELEQQLLEAFADEGIHSIKIDSPPAMVLDSEAARFAVGFDNAMQQQELALGAKQTIFLWAQWFGVACRKLDADGNETSEVDQERFIAGMKAAGYGDLVSESINYNTLGAWVREQIPEGELTPVMPEPVADLLTAAQKFELRARKA